MASVPEALRSELDFDALYDAFGGKLVHWADYVSDFGANIEVVIYPSLR